MSGSWTSFSVPNTSTGAFAADIMVLLTDGSVLAHNGYVSTVGTANQWLRLTPGSDGKYEIGSWSSEIDMKYARQWFASGVLPDGRVFCIGGEDTNDPSAPNGDSATGEIFDPLTNTWSDITKPAAFAFVSGDCNGSVLADGRVMLGGANSLAFPQTKRTAIWDPTDNSWVEAGLEFGALTTTTKTDPFEEETWALLPDGSVLAPAVVNTPQAQRYVPSLDQWVNCTNSPVNLAITVLKGVTVEETGGLIALPNGNAFAIGGTGQTAIFTLGPNPTSAGSWAQGPNFPADTSASPNWPTLTALDAPACLLPSGKVVILAGNAELTDPGPNEDYFSSFPVFLEYDPTSSATTLPQLDVQPVLPAGNQTWQSCFLVLPTGQLLCSAQTNTLFLYTPDPATSAPNPAWKPANISVPSTLVLNHSYTLSGTQINGFSQCCTYGDDAGMATNYPIVQLTNPGTGQVVYLRSYGFSTMGIATGTVVPDDLQSCTIDIPSNLATGSWNLVVIANGIASDPVAVQIAAQDCFFIVDNSTFSIGEIDTYVKGSPPTPAVFNPAFFVVIEGYTPAEIGINTANPIPPQLLNPPIVPSVPTPFPMHMQIAFVGPMVPEDPTLPPTPQRFTFPFSITFNDDSVFGAAATDVTLDASFLAVGNSATIVLTPNPNPYILHGDQTLTPPEPWYLSQDLRVFQVIENGSSVFGATLPNTGTPQSIAATFIQAAVTNLRNNVGTTRADFDAMPQDEDSEVLQLLPNDPNTGNAVYNFAVARVRLRDTSAAPNVRVFFRIWQAQQTNASYKSTTYARATNPEAQPIPVLGVQGDEIITIPFFASPRVDVSQALHTQEDDFNRHDIAASPGETDFFFGCWLDINQPTDLRYPQRIEGVGADGPFDTISPLFPIQQFMVAAHQCLIVEIAYDPDPVAASSDPSNSDKLAQRNLAFVGSPNPGNPASRRVPQTFEVRPTSPTLAKGVFPDELMIDWQGVPAGSVGEVYLPTVDASSILTLANALYTSHLLTQVDANTLRFPAGGATYVPLPPGQGVSYAGLLTLDLPAGIRNGEVYSAVVRQFTSVVGVARGVDTNIPADAAIQRGNRQWRRTTGTFKLTIPVSTKALLLAPEERYYSVMKWVAEAIPKTNRWYPVMQRYLSQIAGRITFMGGNPSQIPATGTGIWPVLPLPVHLELEFVGKIEALFYNRFGDFDGFRLETVSGAMHRFNSREPGVAELARRAWEDRILIRVETEASHPHRPASIIFLV